MNAHRITMRRTLARNVWSLVVVLHALWRRIRPCEPFRMFLDCTILAEAGVGLYWAHRGWDALRERPASATNAFGLAVLEHYPWVSGGFVALGLMQFILFVLTYRRPHRAALRRARSIMTASCATPMLFYGSTLYVSRLDFEAVHTNGLVFILWSVLLAIAAIEDGGDVL